MKSVKPDELQRSRAAQPGPDLALQGAGIQLSSFKHHKAEPRESSCITFT